MLSISVLLNILCDKVIVVFCVMLLWFIKFKFILDWFWVILLYIVGILLVNWVILFIFFIVFLIMVGYVLYGWWVESILLYDEIIVILVFVIEWRLVLLFVLYVVKLCVRFLYDNILWCGFWWWVCLILLR